MANNIANQTKNAQVNSFTGGINTDLHPMLQPNNTLTDCVNGTLITYNGNENMLQNDMGNYALEGAKLPPNYVPIGVKEHAGILYVVAYNPLTKRTQIGSYPSPKVTFEGSKDGTATVKIKPYKIKSVIDSDGSFDPFEIMESEEFSEDNQDGYHLYSNVIKTADGLLHLLGEMDQDEYQLTINDQYKIGIDIDENPVNFESYTDPWMQELKFYSVTKDGKIEDISDKIYNTETAGGFNNVTWESAGWVGVKYELADILKSSQTTINVKYPEYTSISRPEWIIEDNKAVWTLSEGEDFFEDPFVMIPDDNNVYRKHYWNNEIPHRKDEIVYYTNGEWNILKGVVYEDVKDSDAPKNFHRIRIKDIEDYDNIDLSTIFSQYLYSNEDSYLYLFLPEGVYINESNTQLLNSGKIFVFVHEESKKEFTIKSDLEFINIPNNVRLNAAESTIRELFCLGDISKHDISPEKVGFLITDTSVSTSGSHYANVISNKEYTNTDVNFSHTPELTYNKFNATFPGSEIRPAFHDVAGVSYRPTWGRNNSSCTIEITWGSLDDAVGLFSGMNTLKTLIIPEGVTAINNTNSAFEDGVGAFKNCTSLEEISFPKSLKKIASGTFEGCNELKKIHIPSLSTWCSMEIADQNAAPFCATESKGGIYINDEKVSCIYTPGGVTSINDYVFYNCDLTTVILNEVTKVGTDSFSKCPLERVVKLSTCVFDVDTEKVDVNIIDDNHIYYISERMAEISSPGFSNNFEDGFGIISLESGGAITNIPTEMFTERLVSVVVLPPGLETIEERAFANCENLTQIYIPDGLRAIKSEAFANAGLKSISLGNEIENIGKNAFSNDGSSIQSVYIKDIGSWCNIKFENEFSNPFCYGDGYLYVNGSEMSKCTLPDSVETLKQFSFYECNHITLIVNHKIKAFETKCFYTDYATLYLNNIDNEMQVSFDAFGDTTVVASPEVYYYKIKNKINTGQWKFLHTNVYVTGKHVSDWIDVNDGSLLGFPDSESVKYIIPKSWECKVGGNRRELYTNVDPQLNQPIDDVINKYVYNIITVTDPKNSIQGWNQTKNELILFGKEGAQDLEKVQVVVHTVVDGSWVNIPYFPYKRIDLQAKGLSVCWKNSEGSNIEFISADSLEFIVNSKMWISKKVWEKCLKDMSNIYCAFKITGKTINGLEYQAYFAKHVEKTGEDNTSEYQEIKVEKTGEDTSLLNYTILNSNFEFKNPIPSNIRELYIDSVFFIEHKKSDDDESNTEIIVLDQTSNRDVLGIPESRDLDRSEYNISKFKYEVSKSSRNIECTFTFDKTVLSNNLKATLEDLNGDLIYVAYPEYKMTQEHSVVFNNVDLCVQCAQLKLYDGNKCIFNKNILINSIVNGHRDCTNMENLVWSNLIDEIIADEGNEWKLNVSVEVDKENITTAPCAYKLNDNGEMVDIQKWTKDTIPANVIPIVDEDGFIPEYEGQTFADLVYAPVKVSVTLGHGIKITGDVKYKKFQYANKTVMLNEHVKPDSIPILLSNMEFEKGKSISGIPVKRRVSQYLYRPAGLERWLKSIHQEEHVDLFDDYWKEEECLCATIKDKSIDYAISDTKTFSSNSAVNTLDGWLYKMPAVFPIKYVNETEWRGVNCPQFWLENSITTFGGNRGWSLICNEGDVISDLTSPVKVKNRIISLVQKDPFYTFCINGNNGPKYPWFGTKAKLTESEFLEWEKQLFVISLMCSKLEYSNVGSMRNVYRCSYKPVSCVLDNLEFTINARHVNLANTILDLNVEKTINHKFKYIDSLPKSSLKLFLDRTESYWTEEVIDNQWISTFASKFTDFKIEEPSDHGIFEKANYWAQNGLGPKFMPVSPFIRHDAGEMKVGLNREDSTERLGSAENESNFNFWEYPENSEEYNMRLNFFNQHYAPWTNKSDYDFFNQISNTFVAGKLKVTIDEVSYVRSVDDWLKIYLEKLIKELKYERDYNNTLK